MSAKAPKGPPTSSVKPSKIPPKSAHASSHSATASSSLPTLGPKLRPSTLAAKNNASAAAAAAAIEQAAAKAASKKKGKGPKIPKPAQPPADMASSSSVPPNNLAQSSGGPSHKTAPIAPSQGAKSEPRSATLSSDGGKEQDALPGPPSNAPILPSQIPLPSPVETQYSSLPSEYSRGPPVVNLSQTPAPIDESMHDLIEGGLRVPYSGAYFFSTLTFEGVWRRAYPPTTSMYSFHDFVKVLKEITEAYEASHVGTFPVHHTELLAKVSWRFAKPDPFIAATTVFGPELAGQNINLVDFVSFVLSEPADEDSMDLINTTVTGAPRYSLSGERFARVYYAVVSLDQVLSEFGWLMNRELGQNYSIDDRGVHLTFLGRGLDSPKAASRLLLHLRVRIRRAVEHLRKYENFLFFGALPASPATTAAGYYQDIRRSIPATPTAYIGLQLSQIAGTERQAAYPSPYFGRAVDKARVFYGLPLSEKALRKHDPDRPPNAKKVVPKAESVFSDWDRWIDPEKAKAWTKTAEFGATIPLPDGMTTQQAAEGNPLAAPPVVTSVPSAPNPSIANPTAPAPAADTIVAAGPLLPQTNPSPTGPRISESTSYGNPAFNLPPQANASRPPNEAVNIMGHYQAAVLNAPITNPASATTLMTGGAPVNPHIAQAMNTAAANNGGASVNPQAVPPIVTAVPPVTINSFVPFATGATLAPTVPVHLPGGVTSTALVPTAIAAGNTATLHNFPWGWATMHGGSGYAPAAPPAPQQVPSNTPPNLPPNVPIGGPPYGPPGGPPNGPPGGPPNGPSSGPPGGPANGPNGGGPFPMPQGNHLHYAGGGLGGGPPPGGGHPPNGTAVNGNDRVPHYHYWYNLNDPKEPRVDLSLKSNDIPEFSGHEDTIIRYLSDMFELCRRGSRIRKDLGKIAPSRFIDNAEAAWSATSVTAREIHGASFDAFLNWIVTMFMQNSWRQREESRYLAQSYRESGHRQETALQYFCRRWVYAEFLRFGMTDAAKLDEILRGSPRGWYRFFAGVQSMDQVVAVCLEWSREINSATTEGDIAQTVERLSHQMNQLTRPARRGHVIESNIADSTLEDVSSPSTEVLGEADAQALVLRGTRPRDSSGRFKDQQRNSSSSGDPRKKPGLNFYRARRPPRDSRGGVAYQGGRGDYIVIPPEDQVVTKDAGLTSAKGEGCFVCGSKQHWKRDCPAKPTLSVLRSVSYVDTNEEEEVEAEDEISEDVYNDTMEYFRSIAAYSPSRTHLVASTSKQRKTEDPPDPNMVPRKAFTTTFDVPGYLPSSAFANNRVKWHRNVDKGKKIALEFRPRMGTLRKAVAKVSTESKAISGVSDSAVDPSPILEEIEAKDAITATNFRE